MIRRKAKKSKKAAKKAGKKKGAAKGKKSKKKTGKTPGEVRKELAKLILDEAENITKAVISQGKIGQLAPAKYAFEVAHIYPEVNDGSEATREEDCLAKTLLDRLNIPDKPVGRDEEEDFVTIAPRKVELETESEAEKPDQESAEDAEEEVTVVH